MINVRLFNSLFELLEAFPTEESCIKYLESLHRQVIQRKEKHKKRKYKSVKCEKSMIL